MQGHNSTTEEDQLKQQHNVSTRTPLTAGTRRSLPWSRWSHGPWSKLKILYSKQAWVIADKCQISWVFEGIGWQTIWLYPRDSIDEGIEKEEEEDHGCNQHKGGQDWVFFKYMGECWLWIGLEEGSQNRALKDTKLDKNPRRGCVT